MLTSLTRDSVHILANLIINQYFVTYRCLIIFSDNQNFDYTGEIPYVKILIEKKGYVDFDLVFNSFGCEGFVIQSCQYQVAVVQELERQIRYHLERYNQRRYLLINTDEDVDVFGMAELNFIADFLVIMKEEEEEENEDVFIFKTHKYIGMDGNNETLVLDKWFGSNQTFLLDTNLYPDKLGNQQGRELRMATFHYVPYAIVENYTDKYHGTELYSMTEYAKKHNMTSVLVVNEFDYWGEIYPNWTGIGLLGNLVNGRADIGFSSIGTWEYCYHYLDLSKPLVRTAATVLVPTPGLAAGWLTLVHSYAAPLWIAMGVFFLLGVSVFALIKYCYRYNIAEKKELRVRPRVHSLLWDKLRAIYDFLGVFCAALFTISKVFLFQAFTQQEAPKRLAAEILVLVMLVFGLYFTVSYSSGLATVMTLPRYERAINTMEDLVESGLHWGGTQEGWIEAIKSATDYVNVMMVSRFEATSEENLRQYSIEGQYSFAIERLQFGHFAIGSYIKRDIIENYRLTREDLFREQNVIMLRKSSILAPSLDDFVERIFESGIISRIQDETVYLFMDSTIQKAVRNSRHGRDTNANVATKLKLVHFQGAFAILITGMTFAFVVFILEQLVHKRIIKERTLFVIVKKRRLSCHSQMDS